MGVFNVVNSVIGIRLTRRYSVVGIQVYNIPGHLIDIGRWEYSKSVPAEHSGTDPHGED
jgi:hypothetical protein